MKAAILGMGAMGHIHEQVYEAAGVEVLTYDPKDNSQQGRWAAGLVIADIISKVDIVSICSPDNFHAEQIIAAFKAGKHVFCEKPLCHTRKEFESIKAAYNKDCALGMNFPLRWHKPFVEAKQQVQGGELGDIYLIEADYEYGRWEKYVNGWRGKMPGYDIIMGGGLHMIDIISWVLNDYDSFCPDIYKADFFEHLDEPDRAKMCVGYLGPFGNTLVKLTCDFGGSKTHARRLRICGTEDSLYIDDREPTDKGRALKHFLGTLNPIRSDAHRILPAEQIFRVHEIGLSL